MTLIHLLASLAFVLATNLHGLPISKNLKSRPLHPEEMGGHFEGDIKFPPAGARSLADADNTVLWPNNTVPYEISPFYPPVAVSQLIFAMRLLENLTAIGGVPCVTFRPKIPSDGNYSVYIYNGTGCSSYVGRNTGINFNRTTSLNYPNCFSNGTIMHEYMHCLGFYHEQSRPDRDLYVLVNYDTILSGYTGNFVEYTTSILTLNTPYDYGSVMHYPRDAFSVNGSATIVPINPPTAQIGQRITLSASDIQAIRTLYSCTGPTTTTTTTSTTTTTTTSSTTTFTYAATTRKTAKPTIPIGR